MTFWRWFPLVTPLVFTTALSAQFQTPLMPAFDGKLVCAIKMEQKRSAKDGCQTTDSDSIRRTFTPGRLELRRFAVRKPALFHSDAAIRTLYGNKSLQLFSAFSSTVTKNKAYLSSSVLAGIMGRLRFDVSFAQVVASEDTGTTAVTRQELRDGSSAIMRLINNGGSATARVLIPILVGGGTISQSAVGVYFNGGLIGPLSSSDSLFGTAGGAVEAMTTFAIRDPTSYDLKGEVFVGTRTGYQYVAHDLSIAPSRPERGFPFGQVALGIRQGDIARVSVLYTLVESHLRDFMPRFQVSVQTIGF